MSDIQPTQPTQPTDKPFFRLPRAFVHQPRRGGRGKLAALNLPFFRRPPAFVREPLRFGCGESVAFNLPFIAADPTKVGHSYWAVPKTGGHWGGFETGRALAHIYLKYLHQHGPECDGWLQRIALDMFDADYPVDEAQRTQRGQAVGFFSTLYSWLSRATQHSGQELDDLDNKVLLEAANAGLNFDSEAYEASLSDE